MSTYRMVYKGERKINAIKAVRKIAGIGLKEAKDACENESGFIVYASQCAAIIAEYEVAFRSPQTGHRHSQFDWAVGEYTSSEPTDLRGHSPHMVSVIAGCRGL